MNGAAIFFIHKHTVGDRSANVRDTSGTPTADPAAFTTVHSAAFPCPEPPPRHTRP